jgi:hypothetical protein
MKRALLAAGLALAPLAMPQELFPPGVLLLSRIQRHVRQELDRLPNVSCLETVRREFQPAGGKMRALDSVRLEVLADGHRELYASPGERKFSPEHPVTYTGSGVIGDGFFGLYLKEILVDGNVSYDYKGEEDLAGRRVARYDYRLPLRASGHEFRLHDGSGTVGLHGSFWADPENYDVIRLEMVADDFPPTLPLTEAITSVNYARLGLGENQAALLPESGEFRMARFSGEAHHNVIDFTHCRLFGAQSTLSFDAPSDTPARFGISSNDDTVRPLPAGIEITVRLARPIANIAAVGAIIEGEVAKSVAPKVQKAMIAAGAKIRGRIRRMERYDEPMTHYVVAIEFTEVESEGIRYRFFADLVEMDNPPGIEQAIATSNEPAVRRLRDGTDEIRTHHELLLLTPLPGVASFFFRGAKLDLPPGFRTVWKTRAFTP